MNAAHLLKHYERIADVPDAVQLLRRFVLDLAVRGKLAPQDPNEEPASELLKRIAEKKQRSSAKSVPTLDCRISAGPNGWCATTIGDYALEVFTGPFGSALHQHDYILDGVPLINPSHMKDDRIVPDPKVSVSRATALRLSSYAMEAGDIVMARRGEVGRAALVETQQVGWLCGTGSFFLRFTRDVNRHFLLLLFQSTALRKFLAGEAVGTTMVNLNHGILKRAPLAIPPLAEQHRIVAKVAELMALCDQLEAARTKREATRDRLAAASLARLNATDPESFNADARFVLNALPDFTTRPDQIKELRQTILNLAIRGKLIPQRLNDDSVSELLNRIADDKAERAVSARDRRATKISPFVPQAAPFEISSNWVWASLGHITISRDGERVPVSKEERTQRGKAYDYYGASGVIDKIDGYLFDKPLLLIGEDGANLVNRSTPIAFIARGKYWVNNHAHVLDGLSEEFLRYIELFINAIDLKPYVTGTAQPKMNQAKMNSIPIALPPLAEQHRILAKVDKLMALCDQLEASLTSSGEARRRLLEALLHEALTTERDIAA